MRRSTFVLPMAAAALAASPGAARAGGQASTTRAEPPSFAESLPPLRELSKDRVYVLRVLYAEDPRLPTLEPARLSVLAGKVERLLADWYGYRVSVRLQRRETLAAFLRRHRSTLDSPRHREELAMEILPGAPDAPRRILEAVAKDFKERSIEEIRAYLPVPAALGKGDAVRWAAARFSRRFEQLSGIGGGALAQRAPSFPRWAVMVAEMEEADFALTNSTAFGADSDMPIYVIARGGLTTGFVDNNRNAYQAAGMVGLLPFLTDAPAIVRERGEAPPDKLLDVMATFWMHELGHFFLRYAEHYGHAHCVHVAPKGLDYVRWHDEIRSGGPCRLEHRTLDKY